MNKLSCGVLTRISKMQISLEHFYFAFKVKAQIATMDHPEFMKAVERKIIL